MPNANYTVKFEESIFDAALSLYGSVDQAIKLALENDNVTDLSQDLEGEVLVYDSEFKGQNIQPLITVVPSSINVARIYHPTEYQSIFDVALQLNGNFENIIDLVQNSTIVNLNTIIAGVDTFTYFKKETAFIKYVDKNNIIFQTKEEVNGREFNREFDSLSFT